MLKLRVLEIEWKFLASCSKKTSLNFRVKTNVIDAIRFLLVWATVVLRYLTVSICV